MRIRWKLLPVLLFISLAPVLVLRWIGRQSMRELGNELAKNTRDTLIRRSGLELRTLVEEHSRILRQQRDLVEIMLQVQGSELEKRLAGAGSTETGKTALNRFETESTGSDAQIPDVAKQRPGAMGRSLTVSYREQSILHSPDSGKRGSAGLDRRLADTVSVYRPLVQKHPDLVYWQMTALKNGLFTIYPAIQYGPQQDEAMESGRMGAMMNPSMTPGMMYRKFKDQWYPPAESSRHITWSKPIIDPFTMQFVLIVSAPIYDTGGIFIGVTAIAVPVNVLLKKDMHFRKISANMVSLLVRTHAASETDKGGIRIIAQQQIEGKMHHHWRALQTARYLKVEAKQQYDPAADKFEELHGKGVALGIGEDVNYQGNVKPDLSRGQLLLVGTDGLWETRNPAGEMFGKKRLQMLIRKHSRLSAGDVLSSILEALKIFRDSAKQEDDITLVVAKVME